MTEIKLTITKLQRHPERGYWTARVTANGGDAVNVDLRSGSWQSEVRAEPRVQRFVRKDVLPAVAAALQAKVRPIEKRERAEIAARAEDEINRRLVAWSAEYSGPVKEDKESRAALIARERERIARELGDETLGVPLARLLSEAHFAWAHRPGGEQ